ncbi:hypothetical protein M514_05407 [Trichuris suis]|uniref:Uncharacterized protein n=1 Tax=Trichuris suis TaxID=68888 RepID=A0A085M906_9BILA|nr:hypothetical protein M513_05407 [Trichuris suis]KFD72414.1 hypothetical protein M514_05407 [Trichuris suis]
MTKETMMDSDEDEMLIERPVLVCPIPSSSIRHVAPANENNLKKHYYRDHLLASHGTGYLPESDRTSILCGYFLVAGNSGNVMHVLQQQMLLWLVILR